MIVFADQLASAYLFICLVGEANCQQDLDPALTTAVGVFGRSCHSIKWGSGGNAVSFSQMQLAECQRAQYHLL
jgi:hypothetical protein